MQPRKTKDGKWLVDERPYGDRNRRVRKTFTTKTEANQFINHLQSLIADGKEWIPKTKQDNRRLNELIELWFDAVGSNLSDGKKRKQRCLDFSTYLNNPVARNLDSEQWIKYQKHRLKSGIKPKTVNNSLGYIKAIYNYLYEIDIIDYQNPIDKRGFNS